MLGIKEAIHELSRESSQRAHYNALRVLTFQITKIKDIGILKRENSFLFKTKVMWYKGDIHFLWD